MRRPVLVIGVVCLMIATRLLDFWSTLVAAGTGLEGERNVVHLIVGGGWGTLVLVNVAVVGLAAGLYIVAMSRPPPTADTTDFRSFLTTAYFGRRRPMWHLLWALPGRGRRVWVFGSALPWIMIVAGLFAAGGNLMGTTTWGAPVWHGLVGTTLALVITISTLVVVAGITWLVVEYRLAQRRARVPGGAPVAA